MANNKTTMNFLNGTSTIESFQQLFAYTTGATCGYGAIYSSVVPDITAGFMRGFLCYVL